MPDARKRGINNYTNHMQQNTKRTFRFFWQHIKNHRLIAVIMTLAMILGVTASMFWPILFRQFFDTLITDQSKTVIASALFSTLLLIMLVESIEWVSWRAAHYLNNYFQPKIMAEISEKCFEYLHRHSYRFFSDNFAGSLVKKVNRFVQAFERIADKLYWDLASMTLRLLIILGVLIFIHPVLGAIMGGWCVIFLYINYKLSIYKLKFDIPRSRQDSKVTAALADTITNNVNIKLFSTLKFELKKFKGVTKSWFEKTKKAWDIGAHIEAAQAILMIVFEFCILFAAIKLWERDLIKIADFFLIQAYIFEMFHQLWNFGRTLRDLYEAFADAEEMTIILNTPQEIQDKKGAKFLLAKSGKIEFQNVKFSYGKKESVIKDLSLKIKPGERVALIGPSGGGKSTIIKLLLRLFDINSGKILIDGQNISAVTQDTLRRRVALVPQDPILFHRTLMENIRYGRRASDREVKAAAKMANCYDFIMKFPNGFDTYVGERGIKLSGGQRQRVAIARAILSNASILVFDEATSSLDSESEKLIQDAFENLTKNKTTIIIAHRLSTIMSVDKIFVLDGGRIVEEGRHSDLLGKRGSVYKKLWKLQVGGYL